MFHTVWNVSAEEVSIWVGQVVINCITFWDRTIVYDSVNVVVCSTNTQLSL